MNNPAYLHCLYAEDVRQEVSGQLSVIGVYQGGLRVQTVPTTLPKFTVIANLFSPKDQKPASVKLEVCQNGEVLESMEPPPDFFTTIEAEMVDHVVDGYHMQFVIGFNGFIVRSAARLRVRATVNGQVIEGNPLLIQTAADQSPSTSDFQPTPAF